eukprot:3043272-Pyramimonas_sp.AAC.1
MRCSTPVLERVSASGWAHPSSGAQTILRWRSGARELLLEAIADDLSDANDLGVKLQQQAWDT